MKLTVATRCSAAFLTAAMLMSVACEEKAPPPTPGSNSGGGGGRIGSVARGVRDTVRSTESSINDNQQRAVDAANDIASGSSSQADKTFPLAGIEFTVQPGWKTLPASGMRKADLVYTGSAGEVHAVFYTEGGTADDNITRWERQVEIDGVEQPRRTTESVSGLTIHKFDARGTYRGMSPSGVNSDPAPNSRFIGVVIEGDRGSVQIRLVGPEQVVNEAASSFDAMLRGLRKS
ncbi:MAG: hypothetical protein QM783_03330 [Phycisphaerales bacterium]